MKFRRILSVLLAVVVLCGVLPLGSLKASALVSGFFTYTVSNYEATITGYSATASGNVIIPAKVGGYNVVAIGNYAFSGLSNLTSVTIQAGVKTVGRYAFDSCVNLKSVDISKTVENLNYDTAFYGCNMLEKITVNSNNSYYKAGNNVLYNKSGSTLLLYPVRKSNTDFSVPNGVTTISDAAFKNNCFLKNVTIPTTVTNIGQGAFYECRALDNVYISDINKWCSVTFGGNNANPLNYAENLYLNDELVTYVKFETEKIGNYVFQNYKNLTSVMITDTVTQIGENAFEGCSSLKLATLPNTVTSIGQSAFKDCSSLESFTFNFGIALTSIPHYTFSGCESLTEIIIPAKVSSVSYTAFEGCSALEYIDVYSSNNYYTSVDGVLFNDDATTLVCYPAGKTDKTYTVPDTVKNIGNSAFKNNLFIENVTLSDNVEKISGGAFYNCTSLISAYIPNSVTAIDYEAFYLCTALETVTLSRNVDMLINSTFRKCISLKDVYYLGTPEEWNAITYINNNTELISANLHFLGLADINGDGSVNSMDLLSIKKEWFESFESESDTFGYLDINGDDVFNILDLIEIKQILLVLE